MLTRASLPEFNSSTIAHILHVVVYNLTQVSDLDLALGTDKFVAFPPIRYISSRCCVCFQGHQFIIGRTRGGGAVIETKSSTLPSQHVVKCNTLTRTSFFLYGDSGLRILGTFLHDPARISVIKKLPYLPILEFFCTYCWKTRPAVYCWRFSGWEQLHFQP